MLLLTECFYPLLNMVFNAACHANSLRLRFIMTASKVIEEIKQLPPSEQAQVIQFAVELARTRQLTPRELGALADQLAESDDPSEILRLKSALTSGFYGA